VNLIVELPKSAGFDTIMTVVDSVSKKTHFIPTHIMVTIESITRLFLYNIWKLHVLLTHIISDKEYIRATGHKIKALQEILSLLSKKY